MSTPTSPTNPTTPDRKDELTHAVAPPPSTPFTVEPAAPVPDDAPASWASHAPRAHHLPAPTPAPASTTTPVAVMEQQPLVTIQKGPRPFTVMLGLLSMVVAGYVLAMNLTDADIDFRVIGPATFGAFGVLLVLVGLVGVVANGRRA